MLTGQAILLLAFQPSHATLLISYLPNSSRSTVTVTILLTLSSLFYLITVMTTAQLDSLADEGIGMTAENELAKGTERRICS
jgi:hypothetical protein